MPKAYGGRIFGDRHAYDSTIRVFRASDANGHSAPTHAILGIRVSLSSPGLPGPVFIFAQYYIELLPCSRSRQAIEISSDCRRTVCGCAEAFGCMCQNIDVCSRMSPLASSSGPHADAQLFFRTRTLFARWTTFDLWMNGRSLHEPVTT